MKRAQLIWLWILSLALASCSVLGGDEDKTSEPVGNIPGGYRPSMAIDWDHDPSTIVFRAEVVGGEDDDAFYRRNDVPYCTIYGDGRIVWMTEPRAGYEG